MNGIYRVPKHLKDYDDPRQTGIAEVKAELAAEYFFIGDSRAVYLQGTIGTLEVNETFILGFAHNSEIEGRMISFGTFKTTKTNGIDVAFTDTLYATDSVDVNDTIASARW